MPRRKLSPQIKEARKQFTKSSKIIIVKAAQEAVLHFKEGFQKGGFTNWRLKRWEKRDPDPDPGRGVLIGKGGGGKLWKSIKRGRVTGRGTGKRVVIGIKGKPKKYADIHNFGGKIQSTHKVRAHTRTIKRGKRKIKQNVNEHIRTVNTKMPQRKFMGESRVLNKKIKKLIGKELKKIL
ncbi:Phage tail S [uncultured Mediterranean phage uvMED]|nr:Phage tail S [uncultured Mediterranean phage uvMED]BAR22586.1 Phage tail S [uncultured Mediterranean phage uvMED]